jgi:uncharacterized membrane protein
LLLLLRRRGVLLVSAFLPRAHPASFTFLLDQNSVHNFATPAMPQQLSSKDASLFRQVVRYYENKQYKKGEF